MAGGPRSLSAEGEDGLSWEAPSSFRKTRFDGLSLQGWGRAGSRDPPWSRVFSRGEENRHCLWLVGLKLGASEPPVLLGLLVLQHWQSTLLPQATESQPETEDSTVRGAMAETCAVVLGRRSRAALPSSEKALLRKAAGCTWGEHP